MSQPLIRVRLCIAALALVLGACGSRTGIDVPQRDVDMDAAVTMDATPLDVDRDAAPPVMRDAELDARSSDAALLDATPLDGAARPDAGQRADAARLDAALPDAARLDAALPDAARPDSAVPHDAYIPDAGACGALARCEGACVDLSTDPAHCGGCGRACGTDMGCVGGVCVCLPGLVSCAGACVDSASDPLNCGGCATRCPPTASCVAGSCECPDGALACGGACVDPLSSAAHCGACGNVCGLRCEAGSCVGVTSVAVGGGQVCASHSDGSAWCWGNSNSGETGVFALRVLRPRRVEMLDGVVSVAATARASCAVRLDGSVWCWGSGASLGVGDDRAASLVPVRIAIERVVALEGGRHAMCALRDDGSVWCWGEEYLGYFGEWPSRVARWVPTRIPGLPPMVGIAPGGDHACAWTDAGVLWCWGSNTDQQLGRGSIEVAGTAAPVLGLPPIMHAASGYWHVCALTRGHEVYCWGARLYGATGDGDRGTGYETPLPSRVVGSRSDYTSVACGEFRSFAITDSDSWAWGANGWGGLADGTSVNRWTPVRVRASSRLAAVASETYTSCFLSRGGTLACSGWNRGGQVGDGTTTPRYVPTPVLW